MSPETIPSLDSPHLSGKTVVVIISGAIAAYKSLTLIRRLRDKGATVLPILTEGGAKFITPLAVAAIAEHPVYTDLWSLKDESEMGHIRLARMADCILVAPASANLMARVAGGYAADLASAVILASDKPILLAPAMNPFMWANAATISNVETLKQRGFQILEPSHGNTACGEHGQGRMQEPEQLAESVVDYLSFPTKPLLGKIALVTAGGTREAIDPVRFISNRSSGKQGTAIARMLAAAGATVHLVTTEPKAAVHLPPSVTVYSAQTALEMRDVTTSLPPLDIAICAAAVSDWQALEPFTDKLKKRVGETELTLKLVQTPDILHGLSNHTILNQRPKLVIGFAAETANSDTELFELAAIKRKAKGCDWLLANTVMQNGTSVFGSDTNSVLVLKTDIETDSEYWQDQSKHAVATRLTEAIADFFEIL